MYIYYYMGVKRLWAGYWYQAHLQNCCSFYTRTGWSPPGVVVFLSFMLWYHMLLGGSSWQPEGILATLIWGAMAFFNLPSVFSCCISSSVPPHMCHGQSFFRIFKFIYIYEVFRKEMEKASFLNCCSFCTSGLLLSWRPLFIVNERG